MRNFLLYILFVSCFVACTSKGAKKTENQTIAVSILPIQYLVDRVGGGDFETVCIVPPGSSPETYEPTPAQMRHLSRSEAYFQLGLLDFEQALEAGLAYNAPGLKNINLSDGLTLLEGHVHDHSHEGMDHHHAHGTDPHAWLSLSRMKNVTCRIAGTLAQIRPDSVQKYRRNAELIISSIDSLDSRISDSFSGLNLKTFLIYHPFLSYFSDDYGLVQLAIEDEGKEPSAAHMKELVRLAENLELTTVFYQHQANSNTVEALAKEARLTPVALDPLSYEWLSNMESIAESIYNSLNHE